MSSQKTAASSEKSTTGANPQPTPLRSMAAHNNLHATLFQATSAEYAALCIQTYQLARYALNARKTQGTFRNPAVIFDLDETVLDNSAYQAWQIATGTNFHEDTSWYEWCQAAEAEAVPGAVEFIRFAQHAGIKPFYITSRQNRTRLKTLENLMKLGVISKKEFEAEAEMAKNAAATGPEGAAAAKHLALNTCLFMKGMASVSVSRPSGDKSWVLKNKFDQRVFVEQVRDHEIILSVGDNLGDYAEYYGRVYDKEKNTFYQPNTTQPEDEHGCPNYKKLDGKHPTVQERRDSVLQDAPLFGRDFILIPNATYGGWLRAFEANGIGSSDELAYTGAAVREALVEPGGVFYYTNPNPTPANPDLVLKADAVAPKLNRIRVEENKEVGWVRVWQPKVQ